MKALGILVAALGAAVAILFAVPAGFERALANPTIAAWAPETLEGLFALVLSALLAGVALIGARLGGQRMAAGAAPGPAMLAGTALGMACLVAAVALAALAGAAQLGTPPRSGAGLLAIGTLLVLLQAAAEEIYFRGWLQPALIAGWGRWPGILTAAAAFALLHAVNAASQPMSLLNLALAGLWLGLLADRAGGLALPVAAHFGWTWAEQTLLGVTPNPGVGSFGAVIDIDLVGTPWWGGSTEGLTASAALSFALVAMIVGVVTWPEGQRRARSHPA